MFSSSELLPRLGWNERWSALFAPFSDAGLIPGRVVRVDRDRVTVATAAGDVVAGARPLPATGDWVALGGERVTAVLARSSSLVRRDPGRPVARVAGDRTAVLVGASGAGKSTLANRLLGDPERLATVDVREADRKGHHTTVTRELMTVPGGGVLIDTPGLRGLDVWDVGEGVAAAFADVDELAAGCRFRDCRHRAEPGCAVVGRVDSDRLRNWQHLSEPVDRAEQKRRARILRKAYRRDFKS